MKTCLFPAFVLMLAPVAAEAQRIEEVSASKAGVSRPDDLFALPPGQWQMAKSLSQGAEPCTADQCEAGYTSGSLVVSVEHAGEYVRIIAGVMECEQTAFSEVEVGKKPGKPTFGRVRKQLERVVKGLGKTCKVTPPTVPDLNVAAMFLKDSPAKT